MSGASAEALRSLAALLRSGLTLRAALVRWPQEAPSAVGPEVARVARRIRLGISAPEAVSGTCFHHLAAAFVLHQTHGMDLARWLDEAADEVDERTAAAASVRAASAGALLSGRMVAGLPLLFVPLSPVSRAAIVDAMGISLLIGGVVLAVAGLRWIGRLMPEPPQLDPAAAFCGSVAALLDAGLPLSLALACACDELASEAPSLSDARRLVRLGWKWEDALDRCGDSFGSVARSIAHAREHGLPVAPALRSLKRNSHADALREFDRRLKRAPVLMVVPLTCCVLPAYVLLGLAPFLRSMSLG